MRSQRPAGSDLKISERGETVLRRVGLLRGRTLSCERAERRHDVDFSSCDINFMLHPRRINLSRVIHEPDAAAAIFDTTANAAQEAKFC